MKLHDIKINQNYTLQSEHHVYNSLDKETIYTIPKSGIYRFNGRDHQYCPKGYEHSMRAGDMIEYVSNGLNSRAETWDDLFNPKLDQKGCDHQWQSYVGYSESYDFCTKCNEKRRN